MGNMAYHKGGIVSATVGFTVHLLQRVVLTAHVYGKIVLVLELSGAHTARVARFLTALELNMTGQRVAQSVGFGATKINNKLTSKIDLKKFEFVPGTNKQRRVLLVLHFRAFGATFLLFRHHVLFAWMQVQVA